MTDVEYLLIDSCKHFVFRFSNGTTCAGLKINYRSGKDIFYECLKVWVSHLDLVEFNLGIYTSIGKAQTVVRNYIQDKSFKELPVLKHDGLKKLLEFTTLFQGGQLTGKIIADEKKRYQELVYNPAVIEMIYEDFLTNLFSKEASFEEICLDIRKEYLLFKD